jgi:hypothetical protein
LKSETRAETHSNKHHPTLRTSQNAAAKRQLFFSYSKKRKWGSCIGVARKKIVVAVGGEGRVWRRAERQAGYVVPSTSTSSDLPYITITICPIVHCELQQHIIKYPLQPRIDKILSIAKNKKDRTCSAAHEHT